jgi:hypothetical protein
MKKFSYPKAIKLIDQNSGVEYPVSMDFKTFVRHFLDTDKRFSDSAKSLRAAVKIDLLLSNLNEGDEISLEDSDVKLLSEVVENPESYPSLVMISPDNKQIQINIARQLLPYIELLAELVK